MVREGTVSNVWTGNWKRGEIVKFIAEDQGRESCYSFVTTRLKAASRLLFPSVDSDFTHQILTKNEPPPNTNSHYLFAVTLYLFVKRRPKLIQ